MTPPRTSVWLWLAGLFRVIAWPFVVMQPWPLLPGPGSLSRLRQAAAPKDTAPSGQLKRAGRNPFPYVAARYATRLYPPTVNSLRGWWTYAPMPEPRPPGHASSTDRARLVILNPRNKKLRPFKAHAPSAVDCFAVIGWECPAITGLPAVRNAWQARDTPPVLFRC